MPEVDWGITSGWGGTTRMARLLGRRMAKEIDLPGALHSARRGLEPGLFNRVVPAAELDAETKRLTDLLLMKNQQGLRQLKFILNNGVEADLYTAQGFEALQAGLTSSTLGQWRIAQADAAHGWSGYTGDDAAGAAKSSRAASMGFWVD